MKIKRILWLDDIVDKLQWKHNVEQEEVHEVLKNTLKFRFIEKGHRTNENVYMAMGQTDTGRYLVIFFIHKQNHPALILSAREMTTSERSGYDCPQSPAPMKARSSPMENGEW